MLPRSNPASSPDLYSKLLIAPLGVRVHTLFSAPTYFRHSVGCYGRHHSRVLKNAGIMLGA